MQRHGARANGGQQIVSIARGEDENQMRRRLFERFEQRIGGLIVGALDLIDEEDAPVALERLERRALLEESHLLDGDLAQRAVGREAEEIGMGGEEERI